MGTARDLIIQHYALLDRRDLDAIEKLFAPDVETVTPQGTLKTRDEFRMMGETFMTAFTDMHHEALRIFEDGDTAITEVVFTGRHTGPMVTPDGAIPPTGNTVSFASADFVQVRDGVCVSHRIYWDNVALMAQLGALQ